MDVLRITGGRPLFGAVGVAGAKNAALPIMAASILADGPVCLSGVPRLADVATLGRLLGRLGVRVYRAADGCVVLNNLESEVVRADHDLVRRMRAGFCVLGPLLARRGRAVVALPGGCRIGSRPVDLHLAGLAALGADVRIRHGYVIAEARRLRGATIDLSGPRGPTVTGTANVMSAATLARGTTVIHGAAREPEIVDLGRFLQAMGAAIEGLGTPTLRIRGVEALVGTAHRVIPDRIEAATLLAACAIVGGRVTVGGVDANLMTSVLDALDAAGAGLWIDGDRITIQADRVCRPLNVTARPYPGVPTDVQAQLTALATIAPGRSVIRDRVFPERFTHLAELTRMGASVAHRRGAAVVTGVNALTGAEVAAADLRAGAALVLAALAAKGETVVRGVGHLDRGYEALECKLAALGARIERTAASGATFHLPRLASGV